MEIVLFLLILALAFHALSLRSRVEELSERLTALEYPKTIMVAMPVTVTPVVVAPPPMPPPVPLRPEPRPEPGPEPLVYVAPSVVDVVTPVREPVIAGPVLSDRLRKLIGDQEWESLIGGSILNKLGALLVVIGIALFLGFSFGYIGAAGRATVAVAVSAGFLGAGVWTERRDRYRFFARGLIGAGWAALYATAYAIYSVPAAQVITNAFVGSLVVLAVAAGMIVHSLRYRSQAVTGVAYFSAFAALAVTPSSPFSVLSLIPLAASVLYLAVKFEWYSMALFGMVATYATCISRGSSGAPLGEVQALFLAYWVLFELFDLARVKRRIVKGGVEWIYYGNLAGFGGLSYLAWAAHAPERLWIAASNGAVLFLADAIARAVLRPPSSFGEADALGERLEAGSFEVSALVSALLCGASLVASVPGMWLSAGLALEAEALYLLGVRFASPFLSYLGIAAFAHSLVRLGMTPRDTWTPSLVFHAGMFYLNRVIRRPNVVMSTAAAVLAGVVIAVNAPVAWMGAFGILFGALLFEAGLRAEALDLRTQAYSLASLGVVGCVLAGNVPATAIGLAVVYGSALRTKWLTEREEAADVSIVACGMATILAFALLWRGAPHEYAALSWFGLTLVLLELGKRKWPEELRWFAAPAGVAAMAGLVFTHGRDVAQNPAQSVSISFFGSAALCGVVAWRSERVREGFVAASAALTMAGAWMVIPDPYVSIAWTLVALAALELGFRATAMAAFGAIYVRGWLVDLEGSAVISMPAAIAGFYWLWFRMRDNEAVARVLLWMAPAPLLALVVRTAGYNHTAPFFLIGALALMEAGVRFSIRDARLQSYLVGAAAFALTLWSADWWTGAASIALLYVAWLAAKRSPEDDASKWFSAGATLALSKLLFDQTTGGMITVAWGFEGLTLLGAGFAMRERVLRVSGLAVLLVCILKLFLYDLRNLDTLPRILSFIALGGILLGVSWIYTRFRGQMNRLL